MWTVRELARSEIKNGDAKDRYCVPADAVAMRWPCRRGRNESGVNAKAARVVKSALPRSVCLQHLQPTLDLKPTSTLSTTVLSSLQHVVLVVVTCLRQDDQSIVHFEVRVHCAVRNKATPTNIQFSKSGTPHCLLHSYLCTSRNSLFDHDAELTRLP